MDTTESLPPVEQQTGAPPTSEARKERRKRYSGSFLAVARGEFGLLASDRVGRPSKLTAKTARAILNAIRKGSHFHPACSAAGVSGMSATRWIQRGNEDLAAGLNSPYTKFVKALHEAASQSEVNLVETISDQTEKDWRAGAFLLERRYPDRWGKREEKTTNNVVVVSDALATQLLDAFRVAGAKLLDTSPPAIETTALASTTPALPESSPTGE